MKLIKIYTNDSSTFNIKNTSFEVINRLPETSDELSKDKEAYENILYFINLQLLTDKELSDFSKVVRNSSKTVQVTLSFSTERAILINDNKNIDFFDEANINKLVIDKEMAAKLIKTIERLASNLDNFFMLSSFVESFNKEVLFYKNFEKKSILDIKRFLSKELNNNLIKDKDVKVVIITNGKITNKNIQKELYKYIKEVNNYSEINIIELEEPEEGNLEIYCFRNKVEYIDVSTSVRALKDKNDLRYIRFNDIFDNNSVIYVLGEGDENNNPVIVKNLETGFPIVISTNDNTSLDSVDAIIPEEYILEYLKVLEVFYSKKVIVTMADISWVTDFAKGKLTYYKKKPLNNIKEDIEEFKQEIKTLNLRGNAILFIMKNDLNILNDCATALDESSPNLNISCFMPREIYGDNEEYIQIFVFEGDL